MIRFLDFVYCRLCVARVLLIGLRGFGVEIVKNIVLVGIKFIILLDCIEVGIFIGRLLIYLY